MSVLTLEQKPGGPAKYCAKVDGSEIPFVKSISIECGVMTEITIKILVAKIPSGKDQVVIKELIGC